MHIHNKIAASSVVVNKRLSGYRAASRLTRFSRHAVCECDCSYSIALPRIA